MISWNTLHSDFWLFLQLMETQGWRDPLDHLVQSWVMIAGNNFT